MKKNIYKIDLIAGIISVYAGAYLIHFGLFAIFSGAMPILKSYLNLKDEKEKDEPANSCKIRKDLQEAKDLTSFELGLLTMLTDTSELSTIDCVKKHSTALLSTAYIQFLATYRFDEEIESAIKKRCDEIDEYEMASKSGATSPIAELWYKKGLSDAKMKIKGL